MKYEEKNEALLSYNIRIQEYLTDNIIFMLLLLLGTYYYFDLNFYIRILII